MAEMLTRQLVEDGVDVKCSFEPISFNHQNNQGTTVTLENKTDGSQVDLNFDAVLIAVGRKPNVHGIGLAEAGVEFSEAGVTVNDNLRTTNKDIYAVGDCCSLL